MSLSSIEDRLRNCKTAEGFKDIIKQFQTSASNSKSEAEKILDAYQAKMAENVDLSEAICDLPLLCKNQPELISKTINVLVGFVITSNISRDTTIPGEAFVSLFKQDNSVSLTELFKHAKPSPDPTAGNVYNFIIYSVLPQIQNLPLEEQIEHLITDLLKGILTFLTPAQFTVCMEFLSTLRVFGEDPTTIRAQEFVTILEEHAFSEDAEREQVKRFLSCLELALPFFARGALSSKFVNFLTLQLKTPPKRNHLFQHVIKLKLDKAVAEISPYVTEDDIETMFPLIFDILLEPLYEKNKGKGKQHPQEEKKLPAVEGLIYVLLTFAHKAPDLARRFCGYKIIDSDVFQNSETYLKFSKRLTRLKEITYRAMKNRAEDMAEKDKAIWQCKCKNGECELLIQDRLRIKNLLRTYVNILAMLKVLDKEAPSFIDTKDVNLSWKKAKYEAPPSQCDEQKESKPPPRD